MTNTCNEQVRENIRALQEYAWEKFGDHPDAGLAESIAMFKAARLFNFRFVKAHELTLSDVNILGGDASEGSKPFPFVTDNDISQLIAERDEYHIASSTVDCDYDLWQFWRDNKTRLPCWYKIAKDVALIQPSSAFMERVFSILRACMDERQESSFSDRIGAAALLKTSSQLLPGVRTEQAMAQYPQRRFAPSSGRRRSATSFAASRKDADRGSYSWEESVLDKAVKDMLVERAVDTVRHLWNETGGDIYGQWLDRFTLRQNLGDDVIPTMGWARFLIKMMREEPVEVVVIRTAKKDSVQVVEAQRKNNARPPTLSPWRHNVNQLSADWDAEEEEEMKVALDYPPQLKAVKKAVVVQPVEMAKKLMDIREQLADEWKEDLQNIQLENDEILRVDEERRRLRNEDEVQRGRRLTYDHGEAFSGSSSPFRSGNYEALVGYLTEIGALAVQERMRVDGDEMGWNWMEQFLYWAKTNSKSGSALHGDEVVGPPPPLPSESTGGDGVVGEGRGARGKKVGAAFGAVGVGIYGTEEDKKMRGNRMLEEMMLGTKVQTFDFEKNKLVGVDPAEICKIVMQARLGVAERIIAALETVPEDHAVVMRRYLEDKWESVGLMDGGGDEGGGDAEG
eukprot:g17438.t1